MDQCPYSSSPAHAKAMSYGSYLKIPELLALQVPVSDGPEHDETLFIVIHQVYELWFKQMLHEGDHLVAVMTDDQQQGVTATLKRMLTILKTMVKQIDVLETMTPISFLSFRKFLQDSSGFQSAQFREFEFMLGYKRESPLKNYPEESKEYAKLVARLNAPSLWDALCHWLARRGLDVPESALTRDHTKKVEPNEALQRVLIAGYHERPFERSVCELLVDLDEGVQEWRYRHVMMVMRTIGSREGTGGSQGVEYLKSTLFAPLFPDLWAIRSEL